MDIGLRVVCTLWSKLWFVTVLGPLVCPDLVDGLRYAPVTAGPCQAPFSGI